MDSNKYKTLPEGKSLPTCSKPPTPALRCSPAARQLHQIMEAQATPLGQIPALDRPLLALNLIEHAALSLGQHNINESVNKQTIQDLVQAFDAELAHFTAKEVQFAFTQGAKGYLNVDARHLSTATLFRWVRAYTHEYRPQLRRELKRALPPPPEEPNPQLTTQQRLQAIADAKERWQNGGEVYIITYRHLLKLNLLQLTLEEKWKITERAVALLIARFSAQKEHPSFIIRQTAKLALEELQKVEIGNIQTLPTNVQNQARRLAVIQYFESGG